MMKKSTRILMLVIVLVLAALIVVRIVQSVRTKSAESIEAIHKRDGIPVEVVTAARGTVRETLEVSGDVVAYREVAITPELTERVETIHVSTGQAVAKGQLLVTLDPVTSKLAVDQAEAHLAEAKEALRRLQNGSRDEEIAAAKAAMDQAEASMTMARQDYDRQQSLYEDNATSQKMLQDAENNYKMASARFRAAQADYERLKNGAREEDIHIAESQVALAQAKADEAREVLEDHYLRAPYAGVVTMNQLEEGAIVDFNQPIFSVLAVDRVYVKADVSELKVPKLMTGDEVTVRVDALPGQLFQGRIDEINPAVSLSNRLCPIKVLVDNPDRLLKPGMYARIEVVLQELTDVISLPRQAIRRDGDGQQPYVLIVSDQKSRRIDVTISETLEEDVVVTAGLEGGEQVIVLAGTSLEPGDPVVTDQQDGE